jgi:hypothetical protein
MSSHLQLVKVWKSLEQDFFWSKCSHSLGVKITAFDQYHALKKEIDCRLIRPRLWVAPKA